MSVRFVEISSPGSLKLVKGTVVYRSADGLTNRTLALSDLEHIFVWSQSLSLTSAALCRCAEAGVVVTICNNCGYPTARFVPQVSHSSHRDYLDKQVKLSISLKKLIWAEIVKAKMRNQQALLSNLARDSSWIDPLYPKVSAGDASNVEAQVARRYWHQLFGDSFRRDRALPGINAGLNYGYAVIRSALVRALTKVGLSPCIGVFHRQSRNAHPLADDLIEPLRPFVDSRVVNLRHDLDAEKLSKSTRREIAEVLLDMALFHDSRKKLSDTLIDFCVSFRNLLLGKRNEFSYPSIPETNAGGQTSPTTRGLERCGC